MKIISKYKDYYDYLVGKYGIDEKLVLDRTEFTHTPFELSDDITKYSFWICGYFLEVLYYKGEYLCGDRVEKVAIKQSTKKYKWYFKDYTTDEFYYIEPKYSGRPITIKKEIEYYKNNPNEKLDCPILIKLGDQKYGKFPILAEYRIPYILEPEKIWLMLSEWLGREKVIPEKLTNTQKIVSKGFDLITSFRKM